MAIRIIGEKVKTRRRPDGVLGDYCPVRIGVPMRIRLRRIVYKRGLVIEDPTAGELELVEKGIAEHIEPVTDVPHETPEPVAPEQPTVKDEDVYTGETLSHAEAKDVLNISLYALTKLRKDGAIPAKKDDKGTWRYSTEWIKSYRREREAEAAADAAVEADGE
jgi:hypothetical protein